MASPQKRDDLLSTNDIEGGRPPNAILNAKVLQDLTATALLEDPDLASFSGRVSDSGEGRWTALAAVEEGVPAYVLTAALFERFSSRNEGEFANKLLSAMRKQFGGHAEKTTV